VLKPLTLFEAALGIREAVLYFGHSRGPPISPILTGHFIAGIQNKWRILAFCLSKTLKTLFLQSQKLPIHRHITQRSGRAVECGGLENR
jgi:hypothetical protein